MLGKKALEFARDNAGLIMLAIVVFLLMNRPAPLVYRSMDYGIERSFAPAGTAYTEASVYVSVLDSRPDRAMKLIEGRALGLNGKVVSESISSAEDSKSASLVVKVPRQNESEFESFIRTFRLESFSRSERDIAKGVGSAESEVARLERLKQRLEELMNKTNDPDTLLKLNSQISSVEAQLRSAKQRLSEQMEKAEYTKYSITIRPPVSPVRGVFLSVSEYGRVFMSSLNQGVVFLIRTAGWLAVPALLWLLLSSALKRRR